MNENHFNTRIQTNFIVSSFVYILAVGLAWNGVGAGNDALINFIYSQNLAAGEGLRYSTGVGPVEGATPFLWTIILSIGDIIGIPTPIWARIASIISGIILLFIISKLSSKLSNSKLGTYVPPVVAALSYLTHHSLSGFSTVAYVTSYVAMCWVTIQYIEKLPSQKSLISIAICGIILSLVRPEGAILAYSILSIILFINRRDFIYAILYFTVPLGVYHTGRVLYFGHLFPNPFYVKSGGALVPTLKTNFLTSVEAFGTVNIMLLLLIPIGVWYLISNRDRRARAATVFSIPVIVHYFIYLFLTQAQNDLYRFQYIYIVFAAMMLIFVFDHLSAVIDIQEDILRLRSNIKNYNIWQVSRLLFTFIVVFALITQPVLSLTQVSDGTTWRGNEVNEGVAVTDRSAAASELKKYSNSGYVMATGQAELPYYTEWNNTVDILGVNDEHIAHNGFTKSYLESRDPDVIMILGSALPPACGDKKTKLVGVSNPRQLTHEYAVNNGFTIATVIGSGRSYQWWYVSKNISDSQAIIQDLKTVNTETLEYDYDRINCSKK